MATATEAGGGKQAFTEQVPRLRSVQDDVEVRLVTIALRHPYDLSRLDALPLLPGETTAS